MKKYFYFAAALLTLASCANDDFVGENEEGTSTQKAISLNLETPALTRATGSAAATALGSQFIIWGEKNESSSSVTSPTADKNMVLKNYTVNYLDGSANSTNSNSKGWEYVNQTPYAATYVSPSIAGNTSPANNQTIKYWDYGADNYVFTAISANKADLTDATPNVKITKVTSGTTKYLKGYTITVTKDADLSSLYFSDRNEITKSTGTDRTATNAYGGIATMTFRNAMTKIRVGIYETIPGYKISAIKFYTDGANAANPAFSALDDEAKVSTTSAFGAAVPNAKTGVAGTLTVTYYDGQNNTNENQPKVTYAVASGSTAQNDIVLGTNMNTVAASSGLATSAASPTYETVDGAYTSVFPQPDNTTSMKIKCDYTLKSLDTSEEINVTGATAEIPGQYLAWQANYTYTYLLKISDNTNGHPGSTDVTGLYPITLDAVTVESSDGVQQTITSVSEPSITTYAKGAVNDEYYKSDNIYVSVVGATLATTNSKLYTAAVESGADQGITEETVKNCLANYTGVTTSTSLTAVTGLTAGTSDVSSYYTKTGDVYYKCASGAKAAASTDYYDLSSATITGYVVKDKNGKTLTVSTASEALSIATEIAATDSPTGKAISGNYAKFTPTSTTDPTYYVFEYTDGSSVKHYKVIKVAGSARS